MKTIPRNATNKILALQLRLTVCRVYTLDNNFIARDIPPKRAWEALARGNGARLTDKENGTYVIHVHDNHWFELSEAGPPGTDDSADDGTGSVTFMYTELHHAVVVTLPEGTPPMKAESRWSFRPAQARIRYSWRTHTANRWEAQAEVTGPWLPAANGGQRRLGTACVLPWGDIPEWLTALIARHQPAWAPQLPKAIVPDTTPAQEGTP